MFDSNGLNPRFQPVYIAKTMHFVKTNPHFSFETFIRGGNGPNAFYVLHIAYCEGVKCDLINECSSISSFWFFFFFWYLPTNVIQKKLNATWYLHQLVLYLCWIFFICHPLSFSLPNFTPEGNPNFKYLMKILKLWFRNKLRIKMGKHQWTKIQEKDKILLFFSNFCIPDTYVFKNTISRYLQCR